ncbi:MAG: RecQ family ATP-dependent DNA helicase [Verrucomicrobiales bacterium]|nr:RecQ family ATP-dependent DNA helicase [Verrucomicrobiales bacterium]
MAEKEDVLQSVFGHSQFREGQEAVIDILLAGRSALALFPTGAGKSLCYQLPALMLEGLTLVVSPLIALMKDQVESLQSRGVQAARLDSTIDRKEIEEIYSQMNAGSLKLLYVAPERLANDGFLRRLRRVKIDLLAVDEAHCISEWGHNFRPDYLKIAPLAKDLSIPRVLALTATATPRVAADIRARFQIRDSDHVQTGFSRPNLSFHVHPSSSDERDQNLTELLQKNPEGPAVVYVTLQQTAERVAGVLSRAGLDARAYHAGMRDDHRADLQDDFMGGRVAIVVATIAFGMGVDKADIRHVYHYNLPKSLENYVQESGRAGRDGNDSTCEILACADDLTVLENFIYGDTPSRSALKSLVEHVLLQGTEFSISRYDLSQSRDIRPSVVSTALTYLELEEVIIPRGPFYGGYRVQLLRTIDQVLAGHTAARQNFLKKLFDSGKKGRSWYTFDIAESAFAISETEDRIRKAIQYLADMGDAVVKPTGLRHSYRLNSNKKSTVQELTTFLVERFETRETGEIERLHQVVELCETPECIPQQILEYFGESMKPCGSCSYCTGQYSGGPLPGNDRPSIQLEDAEILQELCDEGHPALRQPRQLARFLCGLSSPATTRAKLHRSDHFGILENVPFLDVLAHVESLIG